MNKMNKIHYDKREEKDGDGNNEGMVKLWRTGVEGVWRVSGMVWSNLKKREI